MSISLPVAILCAAVGACAAPGPCLAPDGRFVACRSRGAPVGVTWDPRSGYRCRDAAGITWPSRGECD